MSGILGKKIGMTRFFDESGRSFSATLIEAGPCPVVQVKKEKHDGYSAVQLGFIEQKVKGANKPKLGHFKKIDIPPHRVLREFRDFSLDVKEGDKVSVEIFTVGQKVKITGLSKGGGFAGVMKRHGFSGGPKSHGQSDRLRAPGSIGQSATPKRVLKGMKMPGRRGGTKVTLRNLEILKVIPDRNLLLVKGGVPGARNSILEIRK